MPWCGVAVMKTLMDLGPAAIVPGHGRVRRDLAYMQLVTRALQHVVGEAAAAVRDGLSLDEAKKRIDLEGNDRRSAVS